MKKKTVLVVEDSRVQAAFLEKLLEAQGVEVLKACNGRIGLDVAQQHLPDIIILDYDMPELNGLETFQLLQEDTQTADIPVIMMTAFADQVPLAVKGLDLGLIDFMHKDAFSDVVLLETLRQLHILEPKPVTKEL